MDKDYGIGEDGVYRILGITREQLDGLIIHGNRELVSGHGGYYISVDCMISILRLYREMRLYRDMLNNKEQEKC